MLPLRVAVCLLAASCASPPQQPEAARTVHASISAFPASLSLIGKSDLSSEIFARLVTDSLYQYDAGLKLVPRLAASSEISPDGKVVTLHLRPGVTWQDGTPVTSRDVLFTVRKVREPATEARAYLGYLQGLSSLDAPDPLTVRATYSTPNADVLAAWTIPIVPEHLAKDDADLLTGSFASHPIGCGPFRLLRAEPGRKILLEANRSYWDGAPTIDRLALDVLPDERTAFQALLKGDLDLLAVTPDVWREATSSDRARRLGRMVYTRMNVWYVGWNGDGSNPIFDDERTRRAMVLALDREGFISQVLFGLAKRAVGTYPPGTAWADPSVEPWSYDPAEAARLLDAAGWREGGSGARSRGGVPLRFTLLIPVGTQELTDRMAAWIQQSLAKVGARMEIEKVEWKAFLERKRAHRFQALMASLNLSPEPDQFELYHSSARAGGMNAWGLADPEVDRLLAEGRSTFDPTARHAVYDRLQARLHELEPISCLFHLQSPLLYDARLHGIETSPLGLWLVTPGPRRWSWVEGGKPLP